MQGLRDGVGRDARALQLDDAERDHLFALARAASTSPAEAATPQHPRHDGATRRCSTPSTPSPAARALVRNGRLDIIAANTLGRALHAAAYANPRRPVNLARHCFLDRDSAEQFYPDWDNAADTIVAILRAEAGRDPYDKDLQDLIGELSTLSDSSMSSRPLRTRAGPAGPRPTKNPPPRHPLTPTTPTGDPTIEAAKR